MTYLIAARALLARIPREAWIALAVLIVMFSGWLWFKDAISDAREAGAQVQREESLTTTIERTEQANETREVIQSQVRDGAGSDLYAQCVRTARTPANCERFLPSREAADR